MKKFLTCVAVGLFALGVIGCSTDSGEEAVWPYEGLDGELQATPTDEGSVFLQIERAPQQVAELVAELTWPGQQAPVKQQLQINSDRTAKAAVSRIPDGAEVSVRIFGYADQATQPEAAGPIWIVEGDVISDGGYMTPIQLVGQSGNCQDYDQDSYGVDCQAGPDCDESDSSRFNILFGYPDYDQDGHPADYDDGPSRLCTGDSLPANWAEQLNGESDCNDWDSSVWRILDVYPDRDGDGYGYCGDHLTEWCSGDQAPVGTSENNQDCDDHDSSVFDCDCGQSGPDGDSGDGACEDIDQDGYGVNCAAGLDCNDHDSSVYQILYGYPDYDQDGHPADYDDGPSEVCTGDTLPPNWYEQLNGESDCNDWNASVWQILVVYPDRDDDGYGYMGDHSTDWCSGAQAPTGTSTNNLDCDDHDASITDCQADGDSVVDGDAVIDGDAVVDGDSIVDGDSVVDGDVVCVPDCSGLECGDDGCGGSCGTCADPDETCVNGICTEDLPEQGLTCYGLVTCLGNCPTDAASFPACRDDCTAQAEPRALQYVQDVDDCAVANGCTGEQFSMERLGCAANLTECQTEYNALMDCAQNWTCDPTLYSNCLTCGDLMSAQMSGQTIDMSLVSEDAMTQATDLMDCVTNVIGGTQMVDPASMMLPQGVCGSEYTTCFDPEYCDPAQSQTGCTDALTLYNCLSNSILSYDLAAYFTCLEQADESSILALDNYLACMSQTQDFMALIFYNYPGGACYEAGRAAYGDPPESCEVTGAPCTYETCWDVSTCFMSSVTSGIMTLNLYPVLYGDCIGEATTDARQLYLDFNECVANECSGAADVNSCVSNISSDSNHPCNQLMMDCYTDTP